MTITTYPAPAAGQWPDYGLAWELRLMAPVIAQHPDLAQLVQRAADRLDAQGAQVDDVEDLDSLVLNRIRPITRAALLDRFGDVFLAFPDREREQVDVVRHPSVREAHTSPDDWPRPLAFPSSQLEIARFPMTVLNAPQAFLPPDDLDPIS